jgi:hypothetical protein
MEKDKKIPVYLTGNGGQSYHDMQPKDAEKILNESLNVVFICKVYFRVFLVKS